MRGFDVAESTARGLACALDEGVRHVEFDLRVTRDGQLVAFHDPSVKLDDGTWRYVDELSLTEMRQQSRCSNLATLDDMCRVFAENADKGSLLHIDVKIAGFETEIHEVLSSRGLLSRVVLVSWIPGVLIDFHDLEPSVPLCFSHLTLARASWTLAAVKALGGKTTISCLAKLLSIPLPDLSRELSSVRLHLAVGGNPIHDLPGSERPHHNHGVIVPDMLSGEMLDLLVATSGYVCVPAAMATRDLGQRYRQKGIMLAVFSVKTRRQTLNLLRRVDPDIIYVDEPSVFGLKL